MPVPSGSVRRHRWIPAVAVPALLGTLLGPVATAPPAAAGALPPAAGVPRPGVSATDAERAAQVSALGSGRRVEVSALTTETRQVFANPDGTFTALVSPLPVRVPGKSGWRAVDTTLQDRPDGTVGPVATSLEMSFSGGGTAPLARLRRDGRELTLRWPGRLPAPTLAGDTATYREVLPGVDLTVRADVDGFAPVLMIRSATAAADPALATLRLGTATRGVSVRSGDGGSLAAVGPDGATVFRAAPASIRAAGETDAASGRFGAGAANGRFGAEADRPAGPVRSIPARVDRDGVVTELDRGLLTAPDTRYPVLASLPSWTGARTAWTQVWSNTPTTSYFNGANLGNSDKSARVGYDATDGKQTRSFFRFDTSGVKGKRIVTATLQTYENYSRSCTKRQVEAWETGGISAGTTWRAQPPWIRRLAYTSVAKGYSTSCPAGGVEFNVTAHVSKAAANGWDAITQGLRASATAESNRDTLSWKKFRNTPNLTIVYNSAPGVPDNLTTESSAVCAEGAGRLVLGKADPTLRATVTDPDNAVTARFEWWALDGTGPLGAHVSPSVAGRTPTTVAATVPSGAYPNGAVGRWRVRAEDGTDTSEWSRWCEFQIDTTRPPIPSVSSAAFPDNGAGTAVMGAAVPVTFAANGGATVTGYEYVVNGDAGALASTARPAAPGGAVTVSMLPDRYVNWIHLRSVNAAGTKSELATVVFYAGPAAGPVAAWGLDGMDGETVAVDSSANSHDATLAGGASWGDGRESGALYLDGVDGYASTARPVLDTTRSFSVGAWVRMNNTTRSSTVLAQVGSRGSALALYYSAPDNRWVFERSSADVDSPSHARAMSTGAPATGVWTHLIGMYDADARQVRLYVNGALAGQAAFTTPWSATGGLQIGRSIRAGAFGQYWTGQLDDIEVYDRPLLPGEIQQVSRPEGRWALDETAGSTATDAYGRHAVTWSTGVSRTAGVSGNALRFSGGTAATSGPVLRTDGSYTVSAWLSPGAVTRNAVAVSQDGNQVSGFNLGYSLEPAAGGYRWSVRAPTTDSRSATVVSAVDLFAPPTAGVWTHLAAVYDAQQRRLRLYVNGQIAGEAPFTSVVNASGPLRIGSGRLPLTSAADPWTGAVDDVRAHSGVLTDQEIYGVYADVAEPAPVESSFWRPGEVPAHEVVTESRPLELGLRFTTATAGSILRLRYLKPAGDSGVRTLTLWDASGAVLARVASDAETASGWQEVRLADPVPVEPGQTYVVSYHTSSARFTAARGFFTGPPFTSGPLTAPGTANGVYGFGAAPTFPTTGNGSNYFADVVFS